MIKIENTPVKNVNGKRKRNTGKFIGKIMMGVGILLAIVGGSTFYIRDQIIYANTISMILLVLGIFLCCFSIPIFSLTGLVGRLKSEIEEATLGFGPVDESALDGYEEVISKYRVFLVERVSKFEYKVMNTSRIRLGHFKREGIISPIYRLKNLEYLSLLTIRKKLNSCIFYEGGEEDESKLIGKLKRPKAMGKPKYWFEDPYKNKIINMEGKGYYLYHLIKDGLKGAVVFRTGKGSITVFGIGKYHPSVKLKIKPYIPDNIVIIILGIAAMLAIIDDKFRNE